MSDDQRSTLLWWLVVGLVAAPALAAADPLTQAESAYASVDFAEAERFAKAALQSGGYDRAQMTRIYFLLGVSAAADGKDDEAVDAFKHLLTIDPDTKLDRGLSPKLQGPMLEARGTPPGAITVEVTFDRQKGALHLALRDPLSLGKKVLLRARVAAANAFSEFRVAATASVDISVPRAAGADELDYYLELLDEHQNRVVEKGSEASPERFVVAAAAPIAATSSSPSSDRKLGTKWLVAGIVGEVLGVVGIAGGIGAYVTGKNAADRWNDDAVCLANGKSRSSNCSSDRSTAQSAQSGAIASFAIGGALIVASTVLFIAAPREPRDANAKRDRSVAAVSFQCGGGPGVIGVACGGAF